MKRITTIARKGFLVCLLVMTLVFSTVPVAADSLQGLTYIKSNDKRFYYTLENGEATFKGLAKDCGENIEIPSHIDGYPVTKIGSSAFYMYESITEVTIPNTVTTIEWAAFEQCSVEKVVIPDSVTVIEASAFLNCAQLTQLTLSKSLTSIERMTFNGCNLTNIELPESLTTIKERAFSYCSLNQITIPKNVTTIEDSVFFGCSNLKEIHLSKNLTHLGKNVFFDCTNLASITVDSENSNFCSVDGVLLNKDKTALIQYPQGKTNPTYAIPDTVTSIGEKAFYYCKNLTKVTIGKGVTSIDSFAFGNCPKLLHLFIPSTVTELKERAIEIRKYSTHPATLYGEVGSEAERYATESGLTFVDIAKVTLGNPNGDQQIDAKDALMVLKIAVGKWIPFDRQHTACDVIVDGLIDAKDALEILKHSVGKPSLLDQ